MQAVECLPGALFITNANFPNGQSCKILIIISEINITKYRLMFLVHLNRAKYDPSVYVVHLLIKILLIFYIPIQIYLLFVIIIVKRGFIGGRFCQYNLVL